MVAWHRAVIDGSRLYGRGGEKKREPGFPGPLVQASRLACLTRLVRLAHCLDLRSGEVPARALRVLRASEVAAEVRTDKRLRELSRVVSACQLRRQLRRRERRLRCCCHVIHPLSRFRMCPHRITHRHAAQLTLVMNTINFPNRTYVRTDCT